MTTGNAAGKIQRLFSALEKPSPDQIFALTARFNEAKRLFNDGQTTLKPLTLGIGKYADVDGNTPLFPSVKKALDVAYQERITGITDGGYLPISGNPQLLIAVEELILGPELLEQVRTEGTLCSCQSIGGTGANFIQGDLLRKLGVKQIALSKPTWGNHKTIFPHVRVEITGYPYYDREKCEIDIEALVAAIEELPSGSAISLHGCCHNPTGADLTERQWKRILPLIREQELIAVFDIAYAGFGKGLDDDLFGVRESIRLKVPTLIAFSFSKIASLYEERLGVMLAVLPPGYVDEEILNGHLNRIVRSTVSNSPALFSRAMSKVLTSQELRKEWMAELATVSKDIHEGGKLLAGALDAAGVAHGGVDSKNGMFALLPFTADQVLSLEKEQSLFMLSSGRINRAAIKSDNVDEIARRMVAVVK